MFADFMILHSGDQAGEDETGMGVVVSGRWKGAGGKK